MKNEKENKQMKEDDMKNNKAWPFFAASNLAIENVQQYSTAAAIIFVKKNW